MNKQRVTRVLAKSAANVHIALYRATGGRIGGRMFKSDVLLLTTTGRKSGQRRTRPLFYLRDGDDLVVVASNGGSDQPPAWWLNLKSNPRGVVELGKVRRPVTAAQASAEEQARLWPLIVRMYAGYEKYQQGTARPIPLVKLTPVGNPAAASG